MSRSITMNSGTIFVPLFCSLLVKISCANPVKLTEHYIEKVIEENESITDSEDHDLRLSKEGKLEENQRAITWKGVYNNETVAVQIFLDQKHYDHEMIVFKKLNATEYPNIEDHGIARVFYYGTVCKDYNAIAMTLFEETLEHRYKIQKKHFSDLSILIIFMQVVQTLKYLTNKRVLHNDIKPENIFLRGTKVFLSDFHQATLKGSRNQGGFTEKFASSSQFAGRKRGPMDDFESLVFTIWYVAGVPQDRKLLVGSHQPEGYVLFESYQNRTAKDKMLQKCAHFKEPNVHEAFKEILLDEMISMKPIPNYRRIFNVLVSAINKIHEDYKPLKFEWVKRPEHWITQFIVKTAKKEFQRWLDSRN